MMQQASVQLDLAVVIALFNLVLRLLVTNGLHQQIFIPSLTWLSEEEAVAELVGTQPVLRVVQTPVKVAVVELEEMQARLVVAVVDIQVVVQAEKT
jgi:hypothetical protein